MKRYDLCDDTCTTDCGHCKGGGHPMTPADAMTQAIARTPSLVQLDNTEADVITAAAALRHLSPPPGRITSTEQMVADDLWYTAYHRLLDALDRLAEQGGL